SKRDWSSDVCSSDLTAPPPTIQPLMAVLEFAHLTWEEVRDLDWTKAVAILPLGAVEAHGPHLRLATDVIIAETMARAAAARLAKIGRASGRERGDAR